MTKRVRAADGTFAPAAVVTGLDDLFGAPQIVVSDGGWYAVGTASIELQPDKTFLHTAYVARSTDGITWTATRTPGADASAVATGPGGVIYSWLTDDTSQLRRASDDATVLRLDRLDQVGTAIPGDAYVFLTFDLGRVLLGQQSFLPRVTVCTGERCRSGPSSSAPPWSVSCSGRTACSW
jgi:hypothetical protein